MNRTLKTKDGSITLFSSEFKEPYHSTTAGALTEAVEKFCKPAKVREKARKGRINLLDSCFGLGYNTFTFIQEATSENPKVKLFIVGYEFDLKVVKSSLLLNWGKLNRWKWVLKELLRNKLVEGDFLSLNFFRPNLKIKILVGEGRRALNLISKRYENFADAIFHDPFSPKVNPELWSYELFLLMRRVIKEDGILATYSAATPVRRALHMAGFGVKEGVAVGRKSKSTLASPSFKTEEGIEEKFKYPTSVPYRDPQLKDERELIRARQKGCINLLKRPPFPIVSVY
ncbi:tRNA (5-methylaminomethyl-2-thiouridine)(34)-methyltransferase MnmD [Thermovibrio sp.]